MKKGKVENMKKRTIIIVLTAALAVSQTVCIFAASSPGTGPVIVDSNSDGSSYDIGERADRAKGGASGSTAGDRQSLAIRLLNSYRGLTLLLPVCRSQWWMLSMALTADALSVKPCREWT